MLSLTGFLNKRGNNYSAGVKVTPTFVCKLIEAKKECGK